MRLQYVPNFVLELKLILNIFKSCTSEFTQGIGDIIINLFFFFVLQVNEGEETQNSLDLEN